MLPELLAVPMSNNNISNFEEIPPQPCVTEEQSSMCQFHGLKVLATNIEPLLQKIAPPTTPLRMLGSETFRGKVVEGLQEDCPNLPSRAVYQRPIESGVE